MTNKLMKLAGRFGALAPIFQVGKSRNEVRAPPVLENFPGRGHSETQVYALRPLDATGMFVEK